VISRAPLGQAYRSSRLVYDRFPDEAGRRSDESDVPD
jgi:hypothetical protein